MGEVPPRHIAPLPQCQFHGHPPLLYRRVALFRADLDDDPRRSRLRLGRAHVGDLQGVPGGVLRLVHRGQRGAFHSRYSHRLSADAVLQSKGARAMSTRNMMTGKQTSADAVLVSDAPRTMSVRKFFSNIWIDAVTLAVVIIVFIVPFVFIFLTAAKTSPEASLFQFSWPTQFQLVKNIQDVLAYGDGRMFRALFNSTI